MATTKNIDEIASVYAQSLLETCDRASAAGSGGNAVAEACAAELMQLAEIVRGDRRLAEFLKTPIVGNDARKAALDKALKGRVSDLVYRFVMVLANHGRAGRIADVAEAFDGLMQSRLGRIEVDMFTVDGKASDEVIATVKQRVKDAFAKDAVLHQYADAEMIGGVKLRIGDQLIDGSVATQLRNMREAVSNRGSTSIRSRPGDFLA